MSVFLSALLRALNKPTPPDLSYDNRRTTRPLMGGSLPSLSMTSLYVGIIEGSVHTLPSMYSFAYLL